MPTVLLFLEIIHSLDVVMDVVGGKKAEKGGEVADRVGGVV